MCTLVAHPDKLCFSFFFLFCCCFCSLFKPTFAEICLRCLVWKYMYFSCQTNVPQKEVNERKNVARAWPKTAPAKCPFLSLLFPSPSSFCHFPPFSFAFASFALFICICIYSLFGCLFANGEWCVICCKCNSNSNFLISM